MKLATALVICALLSGAPAGALAATFGNAVAIGGAASDIALDEPRGLLYIANFTANRIDVMTLASRSIDRSINVNPQPGSIALSPDGQFLVVAHFSPGAASVPSNNLITILNLNDQSVRTYALTAPPLGVAFGIDGIAFIATTTDFRLLDPVSGQIVIAATVKDVSGQTIPVPLANFPPQIIAASMNVSGDGVTIFGLTDTIRFSYNSRSKQITSLGYTSLPILGPRVVSVNQNGTFYLGGWALYGCGQNGLGGCDSTGPLVSEFPGPTGVLNVGSHAIDSASGTVYAQIPTTSIAPVLMIADADNLNVRERLQLPENLAGKSVLNRAADTMYSVSDSGVMVLPVGAINKAHRVAATVEQVIFREDFCDRTVNSQTLTIVDPSGGKTDFQLSTALAGVTIFPSTGVTPATVKISIDPSAFASQNGTVTGAIAITSSSAVNVTKAVALSINNRQPDQRGTILDIPGKLLDLIPDPARDRFYVLRQDNDTILVFDGSSYQQLATLRTSNTPTQMAITLDNKYLLVGHDDSQLAYYYDLDSLQLAGTIRMPSGHYPRSIAVAGGAILAASRVAGAVHTIDRIDLGSGTATALPTLGVYKNAVNVTTMLLGTPSGSSIMGVMPDGNMLLFNASANTFTVSRKDSTALSGAYAASLYDQFLVGNTLYNSSLVAMGQVDTSTTLSTGFVFTGQGGIRVAPGSGAGIIQRMSIASPLSAPSTRVAEGPQTFTPSGFNRTLAQLSNGNAVVMLSSSGVTVLPSNFDAGSVPPQVSKIVNAADLTQPVAPGGWITLFGANLNPSTDTGTSVPLPTTLGKSCLTVNGVLAPLTYASPGQMNAQLPTNVGGNATLVLRTPGGTSNNINLTLLANAPSVFRTSAGAPTVFRNEDNKLISDATPIHLNDKITIYLTGMGATAPPVAAGNAAPSNPLAIVSAQPSVSIGGTGLFVSWAGLAPGQVGLYQINAQVPFHHVPTGSSIPLVITQGAFSTTVNVAVSE
jgi:uncharacterized protein (TIGR03437 family)